MVRAEELRRKVFHERPRPTPLTGNDEGETLRARDLRLCLGCDDAVQPSGVHHLAGAGRSVPGSYPAPLFSQLRPVLQTLSNFAFKTTLGRVVELLPL